MRLLLALTWLGLYATPGNAAFAEPPAGCARLADVVFHAVLADALPGRVTLVTPDSGVNECTDTAATVSRAFTSAMARLGVSLVWGASGSAHCSTCELSACAPGPHPNVGADSRQAAERWHAVQQSLVGRLSRGHDADHLRFSVAELQRSLDVALAMSAGGRSGDGR